MGSAGTPGTDGSPLVPGREGADTGKDGSPVERDTGRLTGSVGVPGTETGTGIGGLGRGPGRFKADAEAIAAMAPREKKLEGCMVTSRS